MWRMEGKRPTHYCAGEGNAAVRWMGWLGLLDEQQPACLERLLLMTQKLVGFCVVRVRLGFACAIRAM